jgi:hypothetical protein
MLLLSDMFKWEYQSWHLKNADVYLR